MASRKIKKAINIADVFFDEELYPRSQYNWQTGYDYSQSIKTGSKFPPIILAFLNNKYYLVDGKHRLEAHKLCKLPKINAIIFTGWNKKKIFEEAVKYNIAHGRSLSPYEKRLIAQKLLEMRYSQKDVSGLIQVPMGKLKTFVEGRIVNTLTSVSDSAGESQMITQTILKSGAKHMVGTTIEDIENIQENWNMHSQADLLKQFLELLQNKLLNKHDKKVVGLYVEIQKAMKTFKW